MNDIAIEMHAARAGGADVLKPRELRLPPPAAGEVRVAIEATGVAYADIVLRRGLYKAQPLPATPGYDFVGRIEALGPGVAGLALGQRVAGVTIAGSYATRRNVPAAWLAAAPEQADAGELAAATLNGVTAWQMLHRLARPDAGGWVLVHGAAGGVGSLLLDLARLAGLRTIGSASRGKHAAVQARGAEAIDYQSDDVAAAARRISGGGVLAAFDPIGGSHLRRISLPALASTGTAVVYGGYNATRGGRVHPAAVLDLMFNAGLSAFKLFGRSQSVATYAIPAWRDQRAAAYREDLAQVLNLVGQGILRPLVAQRLPLTEAAQAHRLLEERGVAGKIVLLP